MLSKGRPRPKLQARMKSPSKIRDHEIKAKLLIRDRPTRVVQQLRFNSKGQHVDRTGIASDCTILAEKTTSNVLGTSLRDVLIPSQCVFGELALS